MPIEYTIKAIPTVYNGRRYRSRLEAKWAAFFTLLEWSFEYESIDLGQWSPDFQLFGSPPSVHVYVEVKPISAFDQGTADKMISTSDPKEGTHLLLVGLRPLLPVGETPKDALIEWHQTGVEVGWGGRLWMGRDGQAITPVYIDRGIGDDRYDLFSDGYWAGWLYSGKPTTYEKRKLEELEQHKAAITKLWNDACNLVQWHGRDA